MREKFFVVFNIGLLELLILLFIVYSKAGPEPLQTVSGDESPNSYQTVSVGPYRCLIKPPPGWELITDKEELEQIWELEPGTKFLLHGDTLHPEYPGLYGDYYKARRMKLYNLQERHRADKSVKIVYESLKQDWEYTVIFRSSDSSGENLYHLVRYIPCPSNFIRIRAEWRDTAAMPVNVTIGLAAIGRGDVQYF